MTGGHPRGGQGRAPGFAGSMATAIEDALRAKLRAEGKDPLPEGGESARERRGFFVAISEGVIRQLDDREEGPDF